MNNIHSRLDKIEKQLDVGEKPPVIFMITDENSGEQRIEMPSDEFHKLLTEIDGTGRCLPSEKETK